MGIKRITHTHTLLELVMLKAALGKYAVKMNAAIGALRAAGEGKLADQEAEDLKALVGEVGNREGTTLERLGKLIAENPRSAATTLVSTPAEAHAYDVGLPLQARRLRSIEGELRSFGQDDWAAWCVTTANAVESTLKDHYGEQLPLKKTKAGSSQPELVG